MKLTAKQIDVIDQTLVLNGLKYDDIKLEVTDHIASEIEVLMEENLLSFEENLKLVFMKWSYQLKATHSPWVGVLYSVPKIVMDKWASITKKTFFISCLGSLISSLILSFITIFYKSGSVYDFIIQGTKYLLILAFALCLVGVILVYRSKNSTVFSHIFKRTWLMFFIYPIFRFGRSDLPHHNFFEAFISICSPIFILVTMFLYLVLVYRHLQFGKKLSLVN